MSLMICVGATIAQAETPKAPAAAVEMQDQHDQTDIYAIPSDNSEAEEQAEEDELKKEEQNKKKKCPETQTPSQK